MTLVFLLSSSCASRPSVDLNVDAGPVEELRLQLAEPNEVLSAACADPIDLRGMQGMNAGPVERYWITDRASLVDCRDRKAALLKFFTERDAGLAGTKIAR